MPEESGQEKTEEATPKKKDEARKKGQVAKSVELNSAVILLTCFMTLYFTKNHFMDATKEFFTLCFKDLFNYNITQNNAYQLVVMMAFKFLLMILPLILTILVVGVLINVIQVGFRFTPDAIAPKFNKLDPISGLKQKFSVKSLVELLKSLVKLAIIISIAYSVVSPIVSQLFNMVYEKPFDILAYSMNLSYKIGIRTGIVILIMAVLDYGFQKWKFEKDLMMTKEEVKEERKQSEGDPMVRSRIRTLQREMARKRMLEEVPKADVVITNPTELAIALQYKEGEMNAPIVLAKGKGFIAQKIRNIALENDIPIVENKELVRAMFSLAIVGSEIPVEFFTAIAEILANVYKLKNQRF